LARFQQLFYTDPKSLKPQEYDYIESFKSSLITRRKFVLSFHLGPGKDWLMCLLDFKGQGIFSRCSAGFISFPKIVLKYSSSIDWPQETLQTNVEEFVEIILRSDDLIYYFGENTIFEHLNQLKFVSYTPLEKKKCLLPDVHHLVIPYFSLCNNL